MHIFKSASLLAAPPLLESPFGSMHTAPCYSVAHSTPGAFLVKVQWIFPFHFTPSSPPV